jgi:dTDP-4-amino-4,6-dideoxygalactose transaminase
VDSLIPFNVPYVPENSRKYVLEALESNHQQGDGEFTAQVSRKISEIVGGGHILLTPSCTHALEMASMLAKIGPGDEVILPSYTFTSAATAITKFGATPVFVDSEMETKGIDVNQVRKAITPKTKAISWVNYAGVAPDIESLQRVAKEFNLLLIEDNAHGLGGSYKGKPLGSFGDFATQSFHATKNIQCGEGGALVVNNSQFIERAEIIREKGTDRSRFIRGEVQKYQWVDHGSSYLLAESLAGILLGQLENFSKIQENRSNALSHYIENIEFLQETRLLETTKQMTRSAHLIPILAKDKNSRDAAIENLKQFGVSAVTHYQSLHSSMGANLCGARSLPTTNAQSLTNRLYRIPLYFGVSKENLKRIVDVMNSRSMQILH